MPSVRTARLSSSFSSSNRELLGSTDNGAVQEEELTAQPVRQRPPDGRLAGAGRAVEQDAAPGAKAQFLGQAVAFKRHNHIYLQLTDHLYFPMEIVQADPLHFLRIDITDQRPGKGNNNPPF